MSTPRRHWNRLHETLALTFTLALAGAAVPAAAQEAPGAGTLYRSGPQGLVPLPVLEIGLDLDVTGPMIRGVVTERFENTSSETIEAVYVLPLPERAAVDGMEMRIGERRVVAVVKEKDDARATYERAKREGRKTSLVEESRANLFRTSVANVNPGEIVEVRVEYLDEATWRDGIFALAVPLTYTPRYTGSARAPALEPSFVAAGHAAFPRVAFRVRIDAGAPLESVSSPSHDVRARIDGGAEIVEPAGGDVPADRDLVLEWKVRLGDEPREAVFVEARDDGRYALVTVYPPAPQSEGDRGLATTTLFVVDVSGSMEGPSIDAARRALGAALDRLRPEDSFDLLRFDTESEAFRDAPVDVSDEAIRDARLWVEDLRARGGTELLAALARAAGMMLTADASRLRRIVLITDGAVSADDEVVAAMSGRLGDVRLHVVGIGCAPNRNLLRKLAERGRGSWDFIGDVEDVPERMSAFLERIDRPVAEDLAIRIDGKDVAESSPSPIPDLYAGEPLHVSLKLPDAAANLVVLSRNRGGAHLADLDLGRISRTGSGVATRWARARIEGFLDALRDGADPKEIRGRVVPLATAFRLATRYTSLVAVEERPTAAGDPTTVAVPNGLPAGSHLLEGDLPRTGTLRPLMLRLGLVLTSLGAGLGLAWRFSR